MYRPPGSATTRTFHWKTLQSWLLQAREGTHRLQPESRKRGFALALDDEQRQTLLDIRRSHISASADLILSEAVRNGLIAEGQVSAPTLRRLFRAHGLSRASLNRASRRSNRRRWSARTAGYLWHADVCHVRATTPTGVLSRASLPSRSHVGFPVAAVGWSSRQCLVPTGSTGGHRGRDHDINRVPESERDPRTPVLACLSCARPSAHWSPVPHSGTCDPAKWARPERYL